MGQDQVSGGVSVLCWLAAPVAMLHGNLQNSWTPVEDPKPSSQVLKKKWNVSYSVNTLVAKWTMYKQDINENTKNVLNQFVPR